MKAHILNEIRRVAAENGGQAPGRRVFERETGIAAWPCGAGSCCTPHLAKSISPGTAAGEIHSFNISAGSPSPFSRAALTRPAPCRFHKLGQRP